MGADRGATRRRRWYSARDAGIRHAELDLWRGAPQVAFERGACPASAGARVPGHLHRLLMILGLRGCAGHGPTRPRAKSRRRRYDRCARGARVSSPTCTSEWIRMSSNQGQESCFSCCCCRGEAGVAGGVESAGGVSPTRPCGNRPPRPGGAITDPHAAAYARLAAGPRHC